MSGLWQAVSVGQVWLTALMALVAGFPQLECGCDRVVAKPGAANAAATAPGRCGKCCRSSPGPGCCCHGFASAPAEQVQKRRYVANHRGQAPAIHGELTSPQCVTGLTQPETLSPPSARVNTTAGALAANLPAQVVPVTVVPGTVQSPFSFAGQLLASPPDLVTLHQHFVI
jgi:hypothetical protein